MTATSARNRHPKRQMSDSRMLTGDIPPITDKQAAGALGTLDGAVRRGVITPDERDAIAVMLGIGEVPA